MRLIVTTTGEFHEVRDSSPVPYAILSHVWAKEGDPGYPEMTYQVVRDKQQAAATAGTVALSMLSPKIQDFCRVAREDGFEFGWIDVCCINKTDASELSLAIGSMYKWYHYAGRCYAFLHDVVVAQPGFQDDGGQWEHIFVRSVWFTRGWTLQELIAPPIVVFLSSKWVPLCTKHTHPRLVERASGIEEGVLEGHVPLEEVSVARRMSWAVSRKTTHVEDEAYSLMGIFGVIIPMCYGEGRKAFIRLQEEILRRIPDQTILAWGSYLSDGKFTFDHPSSPTAREEFSLRHLHVPGQYLLASSPRDFKNSSHLLSPSCYEPFPLPFDDPLDMIAFPEFEMTPQGIRAKVPLMSVVDPTPDPRKIGPTYIAVLACVDTKQRLVALFLRPQTPHSNRHYFVGTFIRHINLLVPMDHVRFLFSHQYYWRTTCLSPRPERGIHPISMSAMTEIFISPSPKVAFDEGRDAAIHADLCAVPEDFQVRITDSSRTQLLHRGYRLGMIRNVERPINWPAYALRLRPSTTCSSIVLASVDEHITIQLGPCSCVYGRVHRQLGILVSSPHSHCVLHERFPEREHTLEHPVHLRSWAYRSFTVSKDVEIGQRLILTITVSYQDSAHAPRTYYVGMAIRDRPIRGTPTQHLRLPLMDTPRTRTRSDPQLPVAPTDARLAVTSHLNRGLNVNSNGHTSGDAHPQLPERAPSPGKPVAKTGPSCEPKLVDGVAVNADLDGRNSVSRHTRPSISEPSVVETAAVPSPEVHVPVEVNGVADSPAPGQKHDRDVEARHLPQGTRWSFKLKLRWPRFLQRLSHKR